VLNVLREAGLTQDDVELVEMQSVDDAFSVALAGNQVDVAPLGQTLVKTYLAKYERDGASTIPPGVRDDAWTLYAPTTVLEDADKAAAIKEYVALWAEAQQWISENPDEFAEAYYVDHEGLSPEDAAYVVDALGEFTVPTDWTEFIARHQENVDTLVTIARSTRIPIATGERLFTKWGFREVLEKQAAAIVQPDLSHAGGILECKKIAAMAETYYAAVAPHCPLGPIALAASLHLDAAIPNFLIQEHVTLGEGYLKQPFVVKDGYIDLPTGPGLGIELDEAALAEKLFDGSWETPRLYHPDDGSVADW